MIEIGEGTHFKQQEELASNNLSQLLNPLNSYQRTQLKIMEMLNE